MPKEADHVRETLAGTEMILFAGVERAIGVSGLDFLCWAGTAGDSGRLCRLFSGEESCSVDRGTAINLGGRNNF
jgi:hypothetical protein